MARFCPNCGTRIEDQVAFCPTCGTKMEIQPEPQPQYAQPQYAQPQYAQPQYQYQQAQPQYQQAQPRYAQPQPEQKPPKKKKTALIIIIAAVVLVIGILGVLLLTGVIGGKNNDETPKTAEGLVDAFMSALCNKDAKKFVDCYPSFFWGNDNETKAELIEEAQEGLDHLFGEKNKASYEIVGTEDIDKEMEDDIEDLLMSFEYRYDGFDMDDVSEYKVIRIEITYTIDGEKIDDEDVLLVVKYKGEWKVFYPFVV